VGERRKGGFLSVRKNACAIVGRTGLIRSGDVHVTDPEERANQFFCRHDCMSERGAVELVCRAHQLRRERRRRITNQRDVVTELHREAPRRSIPSRLAVSKEYSRQRDGYRTNGLSMRVSRRRLPATASRYRPTPSATAAYTKVLGNTIVQSTRR
jgi:hypothetical protein